MDLIRTGFYFYADPVYLKMVIDISLALADGTESWRSKLK